IDGLHVVVTVEEDGGRPFGAQPVAIDDRMARRFDQFHVLQPDPLHLRPRPLRALPHIVRMLRQSADAGNSQVGLELVDVTIAMRVDEVDDVVHSELRLRLLMVPRGPGVPWGPGGQVPGWVWCQGARSARVLRWHPGTRGPFGTLGTQ